MFSTNVSLIHSNMLSVHASLCQHSKNLRENYIYNVNNVHVWSYMYASYLSFSNHAHGI